MENLRSQIDLFLTEVSIELLGNKIYDLNGKRQDKLINLFKALPENHRENAQSNENTNDFLCSLGYQSDFSDNDRSVKEFLDDQLDFIIKDANKTPAVNEEVIKTLRNYKADQPRLVTDVRELNIKRIVEKECKIITAVNESRLEVTTQGQKKPNVEKVEAVKKYYTRERNHLLKMSMDTLRLMKYILNDPRNESTKGELIGFVHAMRSIKDEKTKSFPGAKTKPYLLPRDRCNLK